MRENKQLVVNFFGGPGAGKTTLATATFSMLKWQGIEAGISLEVAKEKIEQGSRLALEHQHYLFGEQSFKNFALSHGGYNDIIVTDSPLLLSINYDANGDEDLERIITKEHNKYENINFFVLRNDSPFNEEGRIHSEEDAIKLDKEISRVLSKVTAENGETIMPIANAPESLGYIIDVIANKLKERGIEFSGMPLIDRENSINEEE